MSALAKSSREAMKAKAERMAAGDPHQRVDASSWSPPEQLNTEAKVGLRPVSRRAYKHGGGVHGEESHKHAGRKPRASGGNVKSYAQDSTKEENKAKFGQPHVGGYKRGGHVDEKEDRALVDKMVKPACRTGKKEGGRKWMSEAFANAKGQLHKATHTPKGEKIPEKKLKKAEHSESAITRKRANLAEIARRSKHAEGGKALSKEARARAADRGEMDYLNGKLSHENPFSNRRYSGARLDKMDDLSADWSKGHEEAERNARADARHNRSLRPGRKSGGSCDGEYQGTRPTGGRCARKDGGRTKKGTNINIIISAGQKPQAPASVPAPPPMAGPPPAMPPAPPVGAMPPGAGPMPMPRKDGGRAAPRTTGYMNMEAGSGSALGRLQKAHGKKKP